MNKQYFVFSDIHGCAGELKLLLNKIPLTQESTLVFLGDYVDRGPNSKEVIDIILELQKEYEVITLKGNHEELFEGFLADEDSQAAGFFIYNGGGKTLASYADESGSYSIPSEHRDFLENLDFFYETEDYLFVHAGLPDKPIKELGPGDSSELLWIRGPFFKSSFDWGKLIIHGHTPVMEPFIDDKRINIDTGCVFDNRLTALELPTKKFYSVTKQPVERVIHLRDVNSARRAVRFSGQLTVYVLRDKELHQFETENYSEVGMLLKDIISPEQKVLHAGDQIQGEITSETHETVFFKGKVIRIIKRETEHLYAIDLLESNDKPFEK